MTPVPSSTNTPVPTNTAAPTVTPTPNVIFNAKVFPGINDLPSFREDAKFTFKGTRQDGTTVDEEREIVVEIVKDSSEEYIRVRVSGLTAAGQNTPGDRQNAEVEFYLKGQKFYTNIMGNWLMMDYNLIGDIEPEINVLFETLVQREIKLFDGVMFVSSAKEWLNSPVYKKTTLYNGEPAHHFIFDEKGIVPSKLGEDVSIEKASGEIYLSTEDSHLIHMEFTFTGKNLTNVTGAKNELAAGTVKIIADHTMVNQIKEITIPDAVIEKAQPPAELAFLTPKDAQVAFQGNLYRNLDDPLDLRSPNFIITYVSNDTKLSSWYQAELVKLGWQKTSVEPYTGSGNSGYMIVFEKKIAGNPAQTMKVEIKVADPDQAGGKYKVVILAWYPEDL